MATRQPRRTRRRRAAPGPALPRPAGGEEAVTAVGVPAATRTTRRTGHRAHHVTTDYHYVRRDLLGIMLTGAFCLAFITAMAIFIQSR